jgi:DnaK suppressor protein
MKSVRGARLSQPPEATTSWRETAFVRYCDMLSQSRIDRLCKSLLDEQEKLRYEIANAAATSDDVHVGVGNHMAEDATAAFDQAAAVSLRRGKERMLDQIEDALERIDAGTYGVCERCGGEIDFARLKAIPQATLCMSCQKVAEI